MNNITCSRIKNTIKFLLLFSVVNEIGDGKFKVDETYKWSNLVFIDIDKDVVSAPDMVKRLEEVANFSVANFWI